ncbi:MAG: ABC transporter substrate-binding protein [Nitrososphaerales archaeon]
MSKEPIKLDRRKFVYAGLGAVAIAAIGIAAYFATRPPEKIVETVVQTQVQTQVQTVEKPVEIVKTEVVEKTIPAKVGELDLWWYISWLPEEKIATLEAVRAYEAETGNKVNLTFYPAVDVNPKVYAAIEAKKVPDLIPNHYWWLGPQLAYAGQLEDLSDVVDEFKNDLIPGVINGITWYDSKKKATGIYAVPLTLDCVLTHFWKDFYANSGLETPPEDWDGYFSSIKKAHQITIKDGVYGFGWPVGDTSPSDVGSIFEQIVRSHGGDMITPDLKLNVDDPKTKKAVISALKFYTGLYKEGFIPEGATTWDDGGNNNAFHTRKVIQVANNTLSIPAYWYSENKTYYYEKMFTRAWPFGPEGDKRLEANIRGVLLLKDAPHKEAAKEFLRVFMKKFYKQWIIGNEGRFVPTLKSVVEDPFFQKGRVTTARPIDPNLPIQPIALATRPVVPANSVVHPAYAQVVGPENIWPKTMMRIITEGLSIETAAEQALNRFKTVFQEYK